MNIVGIKELKQKPLHYANLVKKGQSFMVVRRTKPLFKLSPIDVSGEEEVWEEVIDFTRIKRGGISIEALLKRL